jgi:hypothetical protein
MTAGTQMCATTVMLPELNPQLLFNIGKQESTNEMDHAIRLEIIEKQM